MFCCFTRQLSLPVVLLIAILNGLQNATCFNYEVLVIYILMIDHLVDLFIIFKYIQLPDNTKKSFINGRTMCWPCLERSAFRAFLHNQRYLFTYLQN